MSPRVVFSRTNKIHSSAGVQATKVWSLSSVATALTFAVTGLGFAQLANANADEPPPAQSTQPAPPPAQPAPPPAAAPAQPAPPPAAAPAQPAPPPAAAPAQPAPPAAAPAQPAPPPAAAPAQPAPPPAAAPAQPAPPPAQPAAPAQEGAVELAPPEASAAPPAPEASPAPEGPQTTGTIVETESADDEFVGGEDEFGGASFDDEGDEMAGLLEMDLDDLLDVEVTVASKKSEKTSDAPGMVTVYTAQDVERLGYYNLADLAQMTTGYGQAPIAFGERGFETRGQASSAFENDKHLILVDGIPVNFARSYKAPADNELSLLFADRVEFLRGPGSALYGVSAFSGVVNLVGKELDEPGTSAVVSKMSLGSQDLSRRFMADAVVRGKKGQTQVSASYFGKDASRDALLEDDPGNREFTNWDNQSSVFLRASHKIKEGKLEGVNLGAMYLRRRTGLGEYWWGPSSGANDLTWETIIPYLKYTRDINDKLTYNGYVKGNLSTERGEFGGLSGTFNMDGGQGIYDVYSRRTADFEHLSEIHWDVWKEIKVIGGINYDARGATRNKGSYDDGINVPTIDDANAQSRYSSGYDVGGLFHTFSSFLQLQNRFNVLSGLIATAGVREDWGFTKDFSYLQFSPRVAVVQKFTDSFNMKLLYGRALRAPTVKSVGLNEESRRELLKSGGTGDENIKDVVAETIDSMEGGFSYSHKMITVGIAGFYNETQNVLGKGQYVETINGEDEGYNIFLNTDGKTRAYGAEFELAMAFEFGLWARFNAAFARALVDAQDGAASQKKSELANMPTAKVNGAISYTLPGSYPLTATAVGKWIAGFRRGGTEYGVDEGMFVLDANVIVPIHGAFFGEIQGRNLTDERHRLPSYTFVQGTNEFPLTVAMPGRSVMVSLGARM